MWPARPNRAPRDEANLSLVTAATQMSLFLLGLNHKTAPVEVREKLALPASRLGHALGYVQGVPGIRETAIISTCNLSLIHI